MIKLYLQILLILFPINSAKLQFFIIFIMKDGCLFGLDCHAGTAERI